MNFEKKMIILMGEGGAKGTFRIERNAYGLKGVLTAYNLKGGGDYYFAVKNGGVHIYPLGTDIRQREISLEPEFNINLIHCILVRRGQKDEAVLYGTLNRSRLWKGNLLDGLWNGENNVKEKAAEETFAQENIFSYSGKQLENTFSGSQSGFDDSAVAKVNYYPGGVAAKQAGSSVRAQREGSSFTSLQNSALNEKMQSIIDGESIIREVRGASEIKGGETDTYLKDGAAENLMESGHNESEKIAKEKNFKDKNAENPDAPPLFNGNPQDAGRAGGKPNTDTQFQSQPIREPVKDTSNYESCRLGDKTFGGVNIRTQGGLFLPLMRLKNYNGFANRRGTNSTFEKSVPIKDGSISEERLNKTAETKPNFRSRVTSENAVKENIGNAADLEKAEADGVSKIEIPKIRPGAGESVEGRKASFYERILPQIEKLFSENPRYEEIEKLMPLTKWVKVEYGGGKFYAVGVIGEKPDFISYGVPAQFGEKPPQELEGAQWLPLDAKDPRGKGLWLMFQDAETGESVETV